MPRSQARPPSSARPPPPDSDRRSEALFPHCRPRAGTISPTMGRFSEGRSLDEGQAKSHLREPNLSFPALDFLRFGAALAVMLSHLRDVFFGPFGDTAAGSTAFKAAFFALTRTGQEAVMLF